MVSISSLFYCLLLVYNVICSDWIARSRGIGMEEEEQKKTSTRGYWQMAPKSPDASSFSVLWYQIHLTASCTRDMTRVFTVTKSNLYSLATTNHPSQGRHRRIARQGPAVIQYQCLLCSRRHRQDHSWSSWYG